MSTAPQPFTRPAFDINNVDLYWVRSSILRAVKEALPHFHGTFLDIGCGIMPYRELITHAPARVSRYIGLDIETPIYKAAVDLRWDGRQIPLEDASVDTAMATEVLEHCPEPLVVLKEARRVLKPGGVFFFTVPYIWPLHDAPYDFFRYTSFSLEKLLADAGFADVKIQALGGWNASLAQMLGLWLKRAPMTPEARNTMARQIWPLYQELVKTDQLPADPRAGNTMVTGWTGIARVPAATVAAPAEALASSQPSNDDLPVVLVRSHAFNYSETFIEDHVNHLSRNLTLLYGYPFPRFVKGGRSVLPEASEQKLQSLGKNGNTLTPELWDDYFTGLAEFLKTSKARVVLLESGLMGAFVHQACEKAGLPYVVHFHGLDAYGKELLSQWQGHYRIFFQKAAKLVVVSKAMRAQLLRLGAPADRIVLAPYGVSVDLPALALPANVGPHFLAVGRFVEKKAPHLTLQAFATVHQRVPAARLMMVGDGPLLDVCRQWAQDNGIGEAVTFAGVQSREQVSRLMASSRVFVQHSITAANGDSEGLPLAVLEAGAHGLPVVATRHAGIPDAVVEGVHGYLVAEKDVKQMAERMIALAQDAALAGRMGAAYRERVVAEFSRQLSLDRLSSILANATNVKSVAAVSVSQPKTAEDVQKALLRVRSADEALELVEIARTLGDLSLVAEGLQTAISLDRNCRTAYLQLGELLAEAQDEESAYLCLKEASRLGALEGDTGVLLETLESGTAPASPMIRAYREQIGSRRVETCAQPRRILVVTNLFPPQELGGYGRTMWEFCDLLTRRGHEVKVLTSNATEWFRQPDPGMDRLEPKVERTLRLFGSWVNGGAVANPDQKQIVSIVHHNLQVVSKAIAQYKPDSVLAGNLDFIGHHFIEAALARGLPVLHRLGNAGTSYPIDPMFENPRFCLAGNTRWLNKRLQDQGYRAGNWAVIYPGSPLEHYYRAFAPRFDTLRLAYASIFAPFKGPQVMFEALAKLTQANIPFTLECAGETADSEFKARCEAFARAHGFADRIRWHGFMNRDGLAAMFSRCNTLVFPSVFEEPFGKTQIEAMAAGLAVVSSGTGGTREIVQHMETGLIFKSNTPEDLARQLTVLHNDQELWAKLAAQGQTTAFRFTSLESVRRIEEFFQRFPSSPAVNDCAALETAGI
jgi:glycosyltransferase involved in cell wall biosynthesis/SAM-dependent methyltransferase